MKMNMLLEKKHLRYLICTTLAISVLFFGSFPSEGALTKRYQTNTTGDFMQIGNSSTFDCRSGVPLPVIGTIIDLANCTLNVLGKRLFWKVDPLLGTAEANLGVLSTQSSSSAVLALPSGATVLYARLYWAGQKNVLNLLGIPLTPTDFGVKFSFGNQSSGTLVSVDLSPQSSDLRSIEKPAGLFDLYKKVTYQGSVNVTTWVQNRGSGTYTVYGIPSLELPLISDAGAFTAWSLVVFYTLPGEPVRSLTLVDGFDRISSTQPSSTSVNGFLIPSMGISGKLGIVAYGGDFQKTGDSLACNGTNLTNVLNPSDNIFNSTHSDFGSAVSRVGDLPQTTGQPGSLNGLDLDVIDISSRLTAGDTQISLEAKSTNAAEEPYLGAFVLSLPTAQPSLSGTVKTYVNTTRTGGINKRGDEITYSIMVPNTGTVDANQVILTDPLPSKVSYKPGSLSITSGMTTTAMTDSLDSDQAEYDAATHRIIARLGTGATGTPTLSGGTIAAGSSITVRFTVVIKQDAAGKVSNQATVTTKESVAAPVISATSGNGTSLNAPTSFLVSVECQTNQNCPLEAPICDTSTSPYQCISECQNDAQCQLITGGPMVCRSTPDGSTKQCAPTANLALTVVSTDKSARNEITYTVAVVNQGPATSPGATFTYEIPENTTVLSVNGLDDFDCSIQEALVFCSSKHELPKDSSLLLKLIVASKTNASGIPFRATISPSGIYDPDLSNNAVELFTELDHYQISGGGWSCSIGNVSEESRAHSFGGVAAMFSMTLVSLWIFGLRRYKDIQP